MAARSLFDSAEGPIALAAQHMLAIRDPIVEVLHVIQG